MKQQIEMEAGYKSYHKNTILMPREKIREISIKRNLDCTKDGLATRKM